ncbi:hypothetical protein ACFQZO_30985 [Bradyrhizobium sp. GCM10027634]|nr:hypothetical protein [Bradyrhizobium sp. WYCCWR 12677]MDN5005287.1 hypothetical protein [Bradyrhizobium sp. WYCCWR 12677]
MKGSVAQLFSERLLLGFKTLMSPAARQLTERLGLPMAGHHREQPAT